ncbi:MAG TPA: hypothetical protein VIH05_08590 [Tepidiformaceae bacterium]
MLTAGDEYLTHQTPYTVDTVFTSDRNFYDRYFFNGYSRDGDTYFAVAMGCYPNLGIMDAAFSIVSNGKQRTVRASRLLGSDRMNTAVGPISVQVVEPLKRLRVRLARNKWGIAADLVFEARSLPCEEPHFFRRGGNVVAMDYTRMTQHGSWSGKLSLDGKVFDLSKGPWWGSRDHSWGIRGVGGRDTRGAPPSQPPQFFWTWAPLNFPEMCTLYTVSEHSDGTPWHESGVILKPYPAASATEAAVEHNLVFQKGTRWIGEGSSIVLRPEKGREMEITFKPLYHFLMRGIGYGDPQWGHGVWVGPDAVDGVEYDLAKEDPMAHPHVQTVSQVTAGRAKGVGIFEIIVLGPHDRYGFKELMDPAK